MDIKSARKLKAGDEIVRKKDKAKLKVVSIINSRGLTINRVSIDALDENETLVTLKHTEVE